MVLVQKVSSLHTSPVRFGSDGAKLGLEVEILVKSGSEETSKVQKMSVFSSFTPVEARLRYIPFSGWRTVFQAKANQSLQPTTMSVTDRADARSAPATVAADL